MGMEWCNSYHYVSAIFIEPFQAGIKICTRIRTEESAGVNEAFSLRWFSLCLLLTALHSVYCAVILALIETSMNFLLLKLCFSVAVIYFLSLIFIRQGPDQNGCLYLETFELQHYKKDHLMTICLVPRKLVFSGVCYASQKTLFSGMAICLLSWIDWTVAGW